MMSHKMNNNDDEEMVRLAFRTLDKDGSGSIATSEFKHLMTHIGKFKRGIIPDSHFLIVLSNHINKDDESEQHLSTGRRIICNVYDMTILLLCRVSPLGHHLFQK